jgi:PAS domain S-box-containing protein
MGHFDALNIFLLVTSLVIGFLAVYALLTRRSVLHIYYSAMMFTIFLYAFGYAFELSSTSLENILFWLKIQYLGIPYFPTLFLLLALSFSGNEKWITPITIVTLFAISSITLILEYTNYNNLFYTNLNTIEDSKYLLSDFSKGTWYWIHQAYSNLLILISFILFIAMVIREKEINRQRAIIFIISSIIPWISYIAYLTGNNPHGIDITPFSFAFAGIVLALGIFRFHLFDIEPLALSSVFESMPDGVIIINKQKRLLEFNPAAKEIVGSLSNENVGQDIRKILSDYGNLIELIEQNPLRESEVAINNNDQINHYRIKIVKVPRTGKSFKGWAIIMTNITESKKAEIKLIDYAKELKELSITKDKFFAIIAHDLRNPFNIMINLSDMLKADIEKDNKENALKLSKMLNDTTRSTYFLLHNLLDWAMIQRKSLKPFLQVLPLYRLVIEELKTIEAIRQNKEVDFNLTIDNTLQIKADEQMLKTILRNLMTNAIKYSFKKGTVEVSAIRTECDVLISISDHGTGISDEDQKSLFTLENSVSKTGTASEKGTGLGLILCKEFMTAHKGKIWVESKPGRGSTFHLSFPLS